MKTWVKRAMNNTVGLPWSKLNEDGLNKSYTCWALSWDSTEPLGSTVVASRAGETIRFTLSHGSVPVSALGTWIFISMLGSIGTVIPSRASESFVRCCVLIAVEARRAFCTIPLASQVVVGSWGARKGDRSALWAVMGHWAWSSYIWLISCLSDI